jgi:hypothetical protein
MKMIFAGDRLASGLEEKHTDDRIVSRIVILVHEVLM